MPSPMSTLAREALIENHILVSVSRARKCLDYSERRQPFIAVSLTVWCFLATSCALLAADYPPPQSGEYVLHDFRFQSGEALPELRMHYRTVGTPRKDEDGIVSNAVLILHGTTGNGSNFIRAEFAGELFGPGQLLDAARYYLILPDNIGHGQSSKPSDGLHARLPRYGYRDMIAAQYRLLTEGLHVNHLRLVMGTSMGGMHTWLWGEAHPDFMGALLPLASLPTQISGRNRVWRRMIIDAIRTDPDWQNGDYQGQPHGLRLAAEVLFFMSSNPEQRQKQAPTLAQADALLDAYVRDAVKTHDANDVLYALEASFDYDPAPDLEKIRAPLLAINFADDLINPPELGILEREIKRVPRGHAIVIPASAYTRGHGTHTLAAVWKAHFAKLLASAPLSQQ
jgi:homoserine O-acetyltransferase/O-succinyltransferase